MAASPRTRTGTGIDGESQNALSAKSPVLGVSPKLLTAVSKRNFPDLGEEQRVEARNRQRNVFKRSVTEIRAFYDMTLKLNDANKRFNIRFLRAPPGSYYNITSFTDEDGQETMVPEEYQKISKETVKIARS